MKGALTFNTAMFRGALFGATMLVCGLSACGSTQPQPYNSSSQQYLDTSRVELAIEQSALSQRGQHAHAYCPLKVPQIKDQRFTCIAYTTRVAPTIFTVVQIDSQGNVQYTAK
jgi:hypothetical protein